METLKLLYLSSKQFLRGGCIGSPERMVTSGPEGMKTPELVLTFSKIGSFQNSKLKGQDKRMIVSNTVGYLGLGRKSWGSLGGGRVPITLRRNTEAPGPTIPAVKLDFPMRVDSK